LNYLKVLKVMLDHKDQKVIKALRAILVKSVLEEYKDQKGTKELMDWMEQEVQKATQEQWVHKVLLVKMEPMAKMRLLSCPKKSRQKPMYGLRCWING